MLKTGVIQLTGLTAITLLLVLSLPRYTPLVSEYITTHAQQTLHQHGMPWATVRLRQDNHRAIIIGGTATDTDAHQAALTLARSLWYVQHVEDGIAPKIVTPYTLSARWNGDLLSLSGYVSRDETKASLNDQLAVGFADKKTDCSGLHVAAGAPDHWDELITRLPDTIRVLQTASVTITDQTITVAGKAETNKQARELATSLQALEALGYDISVNVVAMDDASIVCQQEFNRLLSAEKIMFESGGSEIHEDSAPLLQALADTAIFCAGATILISGHTDDVGSEEDNLTLSEQRAKAVKGWLFRHGGVPLQHLKTEGKGTSQPLAENITEEGRAKNRRIEFTVEGI